MLPLQPAWQHPVSSSCTGIQSDVHEAALHKFHEGEQHSFDLYVERVSMADQLQLLGIGRAFLCMLHMAINLDEQLSEPD
jgi:hypothetical protein